MNWIYQGKTGLPIKGRVFDPCCGSGGMFVQSLRFVKEHTTGNGNGGKAKGDIPDAGAFIEISNRTSFGGGAAVRLVSNNC